jgi:hypothetical protein
MSDILLDNNYAAAIDSSRMTLWLAKNNKKLKFFFFLIVL